MKYDDVNQPKHYMGEGLDGQNIECIDAMVAVYGEERVKEWAEINAFKYQWRQGKKGDQAEHLKDKQKIIWYTRYSMGDDPRKDETIDMYAEEKCDFQGDTEKDD